MPYKNPVAGYRPMRNRKRGAGFSAGHDPRRRLQCGQGVVNGDERYCNACGKRWPKNEEHP